jgi:pimeloyl-ACP methyl ester carboxylesterase
VLSGFGLVVLVGFTALTLSVAVAATNVPPTEIGDTPASRGLAYENVDLVTEDNITLAAWYLPSHNGAAVVLLHGAGSTRSSLLDEMEVLAANGYGILTFDARGHGDSEGRGMDFGWFGDQDTLPAIQWLVDNPDVENDRIALVGMSMGGEEAIGAAALDDRANAVVAEGATGRTAADNAWLPDVYGFQGRVQRLVDTVRFGITDVLTDAGPSIALRDAASRIAPRPLLLITADNVSDEGNAARYIQSSAPGSVEVWGVPGADHTQGLEVAPAEWEERVIGFLDENLLVGS